MSRIINRIAALGGVGYVVLVIVGFDIVSSFMGSFEAAPSDLVARFEAHRPTALFWTGLGIEFLGLALLVLFGVRLAFVIYRADDGNWSALAAGGFVVVSASVKVASIAAALAAYLHPARLGPQVVAGLMEMDDVADSLTIGALAVFMLMIGVAALSAALPRWLGWSALIGSVGTMSSAAGDDPGLLLGLAWFVVSAIWLLRRKAAVTPAHLPIAAAVGSAAGGVETG